MYSAKIVLDSINETARLTTFEVQYPRFVHAELMTHRVFSRNSSSSRAIPTTRLIKKLQEDPAGPVWWGKNQSGMQAREELGPGKMELAKHLWLQARDMMIRQAEDLQELGVHKQIVNRLLEPWMWITVIITATEFNNFFNLRCHPDAQPEIREFADMMETLYREHKPRKMPSGCWHLPYCTDDELDATLGDEPGDPDRHSLEDLLKLSTARCARVSYLTHDGVRDIEKDLGLSEHLAASGHWSPFEHQAMSTPRLGPHGNFNGGWYQWRKQQQGENQTERGGVEDDA